MLFCKTLGGWRSKWDRNMIYIDSPLRYDQSKLCTTFGDTENLRNKQRKSGICLFIWEQNINPENPRTILTCNHTHTRSIFFLSNSPSHRFELLNSEDKRRNFSTKLSLLILHDQYWMDGIKEIKRLYRYIRGINLCPWKINLGRNHNRPAIFG